MSSNRNGGQSRPHPFAPALSKLGRSLNGGAAPTERHACILTLLRILDNILNDPSCSNPKLRKIKVANPAFWKRAGRWDGSVDFLVEGCGFAGSKAAAKAGTGGGVVKEQPPLLKLGKDEDRDRLLGGRNELVQLAVGTLGMGEGSLPSYGAADTPKKKSPADAKKSDPASLPSCGAAASKQNDQSVKKNGVLDGSNKNPKRREASSNKNEDATKPKKSVSSSAEKPRTSSVSIAEINNRNGAVMGTTSKNPHAAKEKTGTKSSNLSLDQIKLLAQREREEAKVVAKTLDQKHPCPTASKRNDVAIRTNGKPKKNNLSYNGSEKVVASKNKGSTAAEEPATGTSIANAKTKAANYNATVAAPSKSESSSKDETSTKGCSNPQRPSPQLLSLEQIQSLARREREESKIESHKTNTMNRKLSKCEASSNWSSEKELSKQKHAFLVEKQIVSGAAATERKVAAADDAKGSSSKTVSIPNEIDAKRSNPQRTPPQSLSLEQIKSLVQREREETRMEVEKLDREKSPPAQSMLTLEEIQSMARREREETKAETEKLNREKMAPPQSSLSLEQIQFLARRETEETKTESEKLGRKKSGTATVGIVARQRQNGMTKHNEGQSLAGRNERGCHLIASSPPGPATRREPPSASAAAARRPRPRHEREEGQSAEKVEGRRGLSKAELATRREPAMSPSNTIAKTARVINASTPTNSRKNSARTLLTTDSATNRGDNSPPTPSLSDEMTDLLDEIESELNDDFFNSEDSGTDGDNAVYSGNKKGDNHHERSGRRPSGDVVASAMPVLTETAMETEMAVADAEDQATSENDYDGTSPDRRRVRLERRERTADEASGHDDAGACLTEEKHGVTRNALSDSDRSMQLPEDVKGLVASSHSSSDNGDDCRGTEEGKPVSSVAALAIGKNPASDAMAANHEHGESPSNLLDDLESEAEMITDACEAAAFGGEPVPAEDDTHVRNAESDLSVQNGEEKGAVDEQRWDEETAQRCHDERRKAECIDDEITNIGSHTNDSTTDEESGAPPWTPPDDDDPYVLLFRGIPLPEGELEGDEDAARYRHGFELCHRAILLMWTPDDTSIGDVKYHRKKGANPSSSSISCDAAGGLSNLRRWEDRNGGASGPEEEEAPVILVPLALIYATWVRILGLSDESSYDPAGSPGIQPGKMYSWVVSNHPRLSDFDDVPVSRSLSVLRRDEVGRCLPEAGVAVCNYVCKALRDIGLISISEASIADGIEGTMEPAPFVGVEGGVFEECRRRREGASSSIAPEHEEMLLRKCHCTLARLVYPHNLDGTADCDVNLLSWYAYHHAVRHLAACGRLSDARSLLSDGDFVRRRLRSNGLLAGSRGHCRDCTRVDSCLMRAVEEWRRNDGPTVRAAKDSWGRDGRLHDSPLDISEWKEEHFEILCSISTVLRERVGEVAAASSSSSGRRQLQMEIGDALRMIGERIGDIGVYRVQELEHYEEALQLKSEAFGSDQHQAIADILYIMGCHHQRFHHFKFAQKCYEQALRIYKVTLGYEHLCVARVLHNIGIMYHAKRDNGVALKCLKKSLSIRMSGLGEGVTSDPSAAEGEEERVIWLSVAESYCWIGKIRREKKDYAEARECFATAHKIKVAILGKPHIESAEVLHNVGIVCDDLGLHSQSLSCFREALLIRLANVSGAHDINGTYDVCESLDCIANVYRIKGERQKAMQFFEQCLKRRIRIVSSTAAAPPEKAQVLLLLRTYEDVIALTKAQARENADGNNETSQKIGNLLVEMGSLYDHKLNKLSKALNYFQKALQVFQEQKDYKLIGDTLSLIGVIHVKKSANQKALKCFRDSLVMRKLASGKKETAGVAETLHNIGNCEAREGQFEDSLTSYGESLRIKKRVFPNKEHLSIAKTEHCIGLAMLQLGNLDDALESFEASIKVRRALLGDHLDVSFSSHSIGRIYFHQNKVDDAITCLEEALKIKLRFLPEKHMSLAETQHLLGSLYIKKNFFGPAIPLLKSALVGYKGTRDCEIIKSDVLDLLGEAYAKLGENDHSLLSYEHSLKIKKVVVGKDGVACANVLMEIGKLKSMKEDIDGALVAFKEVKRIQKIIYGKNHLKNADLLVEVGLIQDRLNNKEMAAKCFAEALRMRRKLLDKNHGDIAEALVHTGRMHQTKGDHFKSLAFFQEAIGIYRKLGDDEDASQECANAYRLLGLSQLASGDSENALPSLERCLELRAFTYGTESEQWAEVAYDLGIAKCEVSFYEDAVILLDKFVILQRGFQASNSERFSNALLHLGKIYLKKRNVDNAMVHFDEALSIRKKLSKNEIGVSEVLFQIGGVRELKKQYLESLVCYEESLKLRLSVLSEDEETADIISRIGEVRRIRGQYDLALENFTLALDMYKNTVGETHLSVANTYHSLGYVCDSKNDTQKAMQNHKEGLSVRKLILGGDHVKVAASLDDVAGMYQKQNEQMKALKCLKEALRIRKLQLGGDDIEIGKTLFGMGIIFAAINDNDMAMECYNASLEISARDGSNPKLEAQTLHQIGCVYAANCNYREALQNWRTCLSKYREGSLRDDHYMVACTLGNIEMAENVLNT